MKLDLADGLLILGLLMMTGGVALVHVPAAIALAGVLLVALAVFTTRPRRRP